VLEIEQCLVIGNDLILGLKSSAIGTLVERSTRFVMLLHLPPQPGHRQQTRDKHGPALAGHGAEAVRDAITRAMVSLPDQLRRSLTWDQGSEMSQRALLSIETGLKVYFCDRRSLGNGVPMRTPTDYCGSASRKGQTSAHTGPVN
jgi:IS30 family transposase